MKNAGGVSKWHVGLAGRGLCPSLTGNGIAALASNAACGMPCQVAQVGSNPRRGAAPGVAPRPRGFRVVARLAHFLLRKAFRTILLSADFYAVEVSCRGQYDR